MSNTATHRHPDPPPYVEVTFRLLCHVNAAARDVIGNSGSTIIKHLRTGLTGSKIQLEDGLPNCDERVINIVGDGFVEKMILISIEEGSEEGSVYIMSKAQEGLIRVFEKVLEVGRNNAREYSNIVCRLLAPTRQIGAVIGKEGAIVDGIRKSSGANISILDEEHNPACAGPQEVPIQVLICYIFGVFVVFAYRYL